MRCLHICNDFMGSEVHENLYRELSFLGLDQTIFYPLRKSKLAKFRNYQPEFSAEIIASEVLQKYHSIFFKKKIDFLYRHLIKKIHPEKLEIVHATTLLSDGAIALRLKKEFNLPYIVAVRATDIDGYFKFRPDLVPLAKEILKEATNIIFISKALENRFLSHKKIKAMVSSIKSKCLVINNGINEFWVQNQSPKNIQNNEAIKFLYVGSLVERKNVLKLIKSVLLLKKRKINCSLTIVGGGGELEKKARKLSNEHKPIINYLGPIYDKEVLLEIYRNHDFFALPSIIETFGLVYLEALSQGLPILYIKNQGVDGLFDFKIGEACQTDSIAEISSKLKSLIEQKENYEVNKIDFSRFSWKTIAPTYFEIYKNI